MSAADRQAAYLAQRAMDRDALLREVARLSFIVENLREEAAEWRSFAKTLPADQAAWMDECAMNVEQTLDAAGPAGYRLHPQRMIAIHLQAAAELQAAIAEQAEAEL